MRRFLGFLFKVIGYSLVGLILIAIVGSCLQQAAENQPAHSRPVPLGAAENQPATSKPAGAAGMTMEDFKQRVPMYQWINKAEFIRKNGRPDHILPVTQVNSYWYYQCADGQVRIEVQEDPRKPLLNLIVLSKLEDY